MEDSFWIDEEYIQQVFDLLRSQNVPPLKDGGYMFITPENEFRVFPNGSLKPMKRKSKPRWKRFGKKSKK